MNIKSLTEIICLVREKETFRRIMLVEGAAAMTQIEHQLAGA